MAGGAGLALSACAVPGIEPNDRSIARGERIVELASGRAWRREDLLQALRRSDFVLLGEQHDNPRHHALRGALIADLGPGTVVVAEHLPRGGQLAAGTDLLARLQAAGFEADAWGWPLHQPLFAAIAAAGLPLRGGDIDPALVRRAAREGAGALPPELATLLQAAPLSAAAQAALDADLVDGHCGHLQAARVPAMRAAQRARDASLWLALRDSGGHPAVLVAGNGHVRADYGVPRLIAVARPAALVSNVGFIESDAELAASNGRYSHVWITAAPEREDPCAAFKAASQPS
jgi:uncharacterized iron-regulated protein